MSVIGCSDNGKAMALAHKSVMKTLRYSVERDCQSRVGCHPALQWVRLCPELFVKQILAPLIVAFS